jgi:hypothetical protein
LPLGVVVQTRNERARLPLSAVIYVAMKTFQKSKFRASRRVEFTTVPKIMEVAGLFSPKIMGVAGIFAQTPSSVAVPAGQLVPAAKWRHTKHVNASGETIVTATTRKEAGERLDGINVQRGDLTQKYRVFLQDDLEPAGLRRGDLIDSIDGETIASVEQAIAILTASGGTVTITEIGPKISEALVSTALGLGVAIIAAMAFNFFTSRVEQYVIDMNDVSSEFIDYVLREGRA